MKKNYIILIIFILAIPFQAFSHGACFYKHSDCPGGTQWKNKASASSALFSWGVKLSQQITTWNCDYVKAEVSQSWGHQKTEYVRLQGCHKSGWVKRRWQARGEEFSDFISTILENSNLNEDDSTGPNIEEANVFEESVTFDLESHKITINDLSAEMKVMIDSSVHSTVRIELWLMEDDEDVDYDPSRVFYSTRLSLKGTETSPESEGELGDITYNISTSNGYRVLSIENQTFDIEISGEIDLSHVGVAVISDGGAEASMLAKQALQQTDNEIKNHNLEFKVYPNPASNLLHVSFKATEDGLCALKIFNAEGKLVKEIPSTALSKNQVIDKA